MVNVVIYYTDADFFRTVWGYNAEGSLFVVTEERIICHISRYHFPFECRNWSLKRSSRLRRLGMAWLLMNRWRVVSQWTEFHNQSGSFAISTLFCSSRVCVCAYIYQNVVGYASTN